MANLLDVIWASILLLTSVSAVPPGAPSRQCIELDVSVQVSANNSRYETPRIDSNIDAVDWIWDTYTWSHPDLTDLITGVIPVHEAFTISAQLCLPVNGRKSAILQIASHGLAFDKKYWDVEVNPEQYNYIDAAISQGYSILTYDRIGNGASTKPDAYNVGQAPVETEVLVELTKLARSGKLIESSKIRSEGSHLSDIGSYKPTKIVHVGHSFGSIVTIGFLSSYGELSDGAVLTGFVYGSQVGTITPSAFGYEFAPAHDASRFGDRPSGYLVQATKSNIQQVFLKKGAFEPKMLHYAESIKQTATVGELLSGGAALGLPAPAFTGPVQFFVGEYDVICGGDCRGAYELEYLKKLYPAAADVSVYLQPASGHGLTLSTNATAGYNVIFSYLDAYGL